jgi:hypothetical protein
VRRFVRSPAFGPVLAFGGALVVALASVGSNWYFDERSEQRENQRRAQEQMREYRQAQRLVASELEELAIDMDALLLQGSVPDRPPTDREANQFFQTQDWHDYRDVLAAAIDNERFWGRLQGIYRWAEAERLWLEKRKPGERLKAREIRVMTSMRAEISQLQDEWPIPSSIVD